tara:strand:+ start:308 stop:904 length:597 start_codon:yes stop_codon:yes gene_type:complete
MDKLLDTITNSCEGLKGKGIITDNEYDKCRSIANDDKREQYSNEENKLYIDKVYGSESDKITSGEKGKYNNYKKLYTSNIDSLKKAHLKNDKQLEFRYQTNLDNIKEEIKELINKYERNIKNTKSHEIYKSMLLKNREMTVILENISKQKNEMLSVKKKHSDIDEKLVDYRRYLKIWGLIFMILLFIVLYLVIDLRNN